VGSVSRIISSSGTFLHGISFDESNALFDADQGMNTVTYSEVSFVPVNSPFAVAAYPNHDGVAYVTSSPKYGCSSQCGSRASAIYKIEPTMGTVSVVSSGFTDPRGVDIDATGDLFVSDCATGLIWRFNPLDSTPRISSPVGDPVFRQLWTSRASRRQSVRPFAYPRWVLRHRRKGPRREG